jgi:hypothetical protein
VVADHLSLTGETKGWWHPGQYGTRAGRSTIDALAIPKGELTANRRVGETHRARHDRRGARLPQHLTPSRHLDAAGQQSTSDYRQVGKQLAV